MLIMRRNVEFGIQPWTTAHGTAMRYGVVDELVTTTTIHDSRLATYAISSQDDDFAREEGRNNQRC